MEEHQQMRGLRPHLVAATPGRLLDHLQKGNLLTENVRVSIITDHYEPSVYFVFDLKLNIHGRNPEGEHEDSGII